MFYLEQGSVGYQFLVEEQEIINWWPFWYEEYAMVGLLSTYSVDTG